MATRTSSPPGSRSKSTSSTSRSRSTGTTRSSSSTSSGRKPAPKKGAAKSTAKRKPAARKPAARRPAPRAVRSGPGPVSRMFGALFHAIGAIWLAIAHGGGAVARGIGHGARELEPDQRRDGVGLFLLGTAVVVAAAVWWQLPGAVMAVARTVVQGSVGKVGFLVPLALLYVGWGPMRAPEHAGPAGRQVIGWTSLAFGILGIVQIAEGNPQPDLGDTSDLQRAGGAIGYVVASLLLDLLRSAYVVVPLLALLVFFGVLIIPATPLYQVPARLAETRDHLLGREPYADEDPD